LSKKSILVVDDELLIRDLLYDFFSEKGWLVSVNESPDRGVEALKIRNFDIALVDLKMPEIDGIELIRKIRNIKPSLPVVIMTAFPSAESAIEALRLKVDDYIIKPFNINKLFKVLDDIVEERKRSEKVKTEQLEI